MKNFELTKDGGMIAYMLYKCCDYDATVACYKNGLYPALDNEVKGLKIVYIKRIFNVEFLDNILFLLLNFRRYDIVHMFHWVLPNQLVCFFFKLLKLGKGIAYIKMDAEDDKIKKVNGFKLWIIEKTLNYIDIVSVETIGLSNYLNKNTKCKVENIPNGFYDDGIRNDVEFSDKENIVLTVGRIGTIQKASEILLEGFKIFAQKNELWKLRIVGTIEPDFQIFVSNFFKKYPFLIERIEFLGPIYNRFELNKEYRRAKIFALTSRWEGFPFVNIEAIQSGCYIISTNIPPAQDVTDNQKFGILFPIDDSIALADCMKSAAANNKMLSERCLEAQSFAYKNFYWPNIIKKLDTIIVSKLKR